LEGSLFVTSGTISAVNLVNTDVVVGPAGVEVGSTLGPGEGSAAEEFLGAGLVLFHGGRSDIVLDELLLGQVEHFDSGLRGNNEPVESLGEEDAVDWGVTLVLSEPFALNDVPDHNLAVTGARSEEGRVLNDVEGGDLSLVAGEGV